MNDKQREYLINQVDTTWQNEHEKLEGQKPKKPSLNNYLVAAFLDNSIEIADIDNLKKKIRESVLKFGKSDKLVEEEDDYYSSRREKSKYVKVLPEDIFVIPEAYQKALKEYEDTIAKIDAQIELLNAQHRTIETKIRLGSNAVLDKLIEEADNLADLSLINASLTLTLPSSTTPEPKQKRIKNK